MSGATERKVWLFHPAIDLVVGCGGWSLPLILVVGWASEGAQTGVALVFYALAFFCNWPHYAATWARAYGRRQSLAKHRFATVTVPILLALTLVVVHVVPTLLPFAFAVYLTWSPWHYSGQNQGLASMFLGRAGAPLTGSARAAFRASFIASYALWAISLHANPSTPLIYRLGLPEAFTTPARYTLLVVFIASALYGLVRAAAKLQGARGPLVAVSLLVITQGAWFVLPWFLEESGLFSLSPLYFATGALALMHCAQYLWVILYTEREDRVRAGERLRLGRYLLLLVVGGVALFKIGPWAISWAARFDLVTSVIIFQVFVNLHHFVLDGAIWKLREPEVAARLGAGGERAPGRAPLEDRLPSWGLALVAVPILLVGALDFVQFRLTQGLPPVDRLEVASKLNPADSRVDLRNVRHLVSNNRLDAAGEYLESMLEAQPWLVDAQIQLAKVRATQGRYEEAYAILSGAAYATRDGVERRIQLGVLADELGKKDEARAHLEGARERDPEWFDALGPLNLDARRRLLDLRAATGEDERAGYRRLVEDAVEANNPGIAMRAVHGEARLFEREGKLGAAADAYRRALQISHAVKDDPNGVRALLRDLDRLELR